MNMIMKRTIAAVMAVTMICMPVQTGAASFCAPAVISASAASSSLTGEKRVYVTTLNPASYAKKKAELVIKVNSHNDINKLTAWLYAVSVGTSGCGNASKVVKYGKELISIFDLKGAGILFFFEYGFKSLNGVSKSAQNAAKEIENLHNKYNNGITVRIKQSGSWSASIQGEPIPKVTKTSKPVSVSAKYYPKCAKKYRSITDALKSVGESGSYSTRAKIYKKNNLHNSLGSYSGSAKQNTRLLSLLKEGKLIRL